MKIERNKLFDMLKERGYVYQMTNEENVKKIINGKPTVVYAGYDPTADSLHIGHFFSLMMLKYFQDAGHRVVALVGGATALVGDPSGRSDMRNVLSKEQVEKNKNEVKALIARFLDVDGDNPAIIVDNADWFCGYDYVSFMRDVGTHFNVNKMLSNEAYSKRLNEGGLTFLEMGYMLMQAYDFVHLNKTLGCTLQIGGSDQWGNMTAGTELYRKINYANGEEKENIECLTCPLLTNSEGQKMGKTAKGALWVARDKTSVFDFYQYFYNQPDKETEPLLRLFTRIPLAEIKQVVSDDIIKAKRLMAFEITSLVHGKTEAEKAQQVAMELFGGGENLDNAPKHKVSLLPIGIADLTVECGLASSKGEVRRLIEQGGLSINGEKIINIDIVINQDYFKEGYALLKKGKKSFIKVEI